MKVINDVEKKQKIIDYLKSQEFPVPRAKIAQRTRLNYYDVQDLLEEMLGSNIVNVEDGKYYLVRSLNDN